MERINVNESEVTDNNCYLNCSIDICYIEEGDFFVDFVISLDYFR